MQVKSVLSAALYPNVAVMDDGAGPNARPTWHDGQGSVVVHPSSVNHPLIAVQYMRPYLVYLEKVRAYPDFLQSAWVTSYRPNVYEQEEGVGRGGELFRHACSCAKLQAVQQ